MTHLRWIAVLTTLAGIPGSARGPARAMRGSPPPPAAPARDTHPWVYVSIRGTHQGMLHGAVTARGHVGQILVRGFQQRNGPNGSTTFTITVPFGPIVAGLFAGMNAHETYDVECDFMQSTGGRLHATEVAHMKNARPLSLDGEMHTSDPGNALVTVVFASSDVEYTTPSSAAPEDSWSTVSSGTQSGGAGSTSGRRHPVGQLTPLKRLPTVTATQTANPPSQVSGSNVEGPEGASLSVVPRGTFPAPPAGSPGYELRGFTFQATARGGPLRVTSVQVTKPVDGSTPNFHHAQATAARLPSVVIEFWGRTRGGELAASLRVTLRKTQVKRDDISGSEEQLVFAPRAVTVEEPGRR